MAEVTNAGLFQLIRGESSPRISDPVVGLADDIAKLSQIVTERRMDGTLVMAQPEARTAEGLPQEIQAILTVLPEGNLAEAVAFMRASRGFSEAQQIEHEGAHMILGLAGLARYQSYMEVEPYINVLQNILSSERNPSGRNIALDSFLIQAQAQFASFKNRIECDRAEYLCVRQAIMARDGMNAKEAEWMMEKFGVYFDDPFRGEDIATKCGVSGITTYSDLQKDGIGPNWRVEYTANDGQHVVYGSKANVGNVVGGHLIQAFPRDIHYFEQPSPEQMIATYHRISPYIEAMLECRGEQEARGSAAPLDTISFRDVVSRGSEKAVRSLGDPSLLAQIQQMNVAIDAHLPDNQRVTAHQEIERFTRAVGALQHAGGTNPQEVLELHTAANHVDQIALALKGHMHGGAQGADPDRIDQDMRYIAQACAEREFVRSAPGTRQL